MTGNSPPFELCAIDHVVLIVDGLDGALKRHVDVESAREEGDLWKFGTVQLRCGASMIDRVDAGSKTGAWARPAVAGGRTMDPVCREIGPLTKAAMETDLRAHGLAIEEGGMHAGARGAGYSCYIRDPWDHQIELKTGTTL